jgi:hypothetical protein
MLKLILTLFGIEYFIASNITNLVIKKTGLAIPEDLRLAMTDRVHRLRLDIWVFLTLIGIPFQFKVWDLQIQLWIEKVFNPIFNFLAFCQGFIEGTAFGLLVAIAFWIAANWMLNQRAKLQIFYLLYRCRAIAR